MTAASPPAAPGRIDARLKVTGAAQYAADATLPGLAHGVPIVSTVGKGRVVAIDTAAALRLPGVLAVITRDNAPKLRQPKDDFGAASKLGEARMLLADDRVYYAGQYLGVVVAERREIAEAAARRVIVRYAPEEVVATVAAAMPTASVPARALGEKLKHRRGDPDRAFDAAEVKLRQTYRTATQHHHPIEPAATTAAWSGDTLVLYDATQWVAGARSVVAQVFDLPVDKVHVVAPFVGGGFGSKGFIWAHTLLAAMASARVGRPVRVQVCRTQMFAACGHRPETVQTVTLGASRDGRLRSLRHTSLSPTSTVEEYVEPAAQVSRYLYACDAVEVSHTLVRADLPSPTPMRAPGVAPGLFALESALDELAHELRLDPLQLRLKNYAERDASAGKPFSSKHLRECYKLGAERFGWERRKPEPRATRDGQLLVGWGMATAVYPGHRSPGAARVRIEASGRIVVQSATQDLGTGTYTMLARLVADTLLVPLAQVSVQLGDSELPPAPISGGSMTAASVPPAVLAALAQATRRLAELAGRDPQSPLFRCVLEEVVFRGGRLQHTVESKRGEPVTALLARQHLPAVEGEARTAPPHASDVSIYSFGAHFTEVRVDPEVGSVRVSRHVAVFDAGRVLSPQTATSQGHGGVVMGIGQALLEQTVWDARSGRPVTADLADYRIPTCADVPEIEVRFVDHPDPHVEPHGARGLGELVLAGVAASIASAVFHATGVRVRELPIRPEHLLG